jgi:hypothetical protein
MNVSYSLSAAMVVQNTLHAIKSMVSSLFPVGRVAHVFRFIFLIFGFVAYPFYKMKVTFYLVGLFAIQEIVSTTVLEFVIPIFS